MQPSKEEFEEWRQNPITEWVMGVMEGFADDQKNLWAEAAWNSGDASPEMLAEARVRSDCYNSIPQSSYEDWKAIDDSED